MRWAVFAAAAAAVVQAWDVARTPPMGFNSWNLFHCGVSAALLNETAQAMHDSGLQKAGYEYVNSDDCWMLAARGPNGEQQANPAKFPDGFKPVADFIHSLGLKSGLYTAKGNATCARFAASCDHETQDAAQWASWGIDYVKDDSCSECPGYDDDGIYNRMWQAIQDSGRPMVLTVEGKPTDSIITLGGYGNAKRVGHDISPNWASMTSLVDIGSGLWMYAHNSTNATFGGWWNDLDMIEVGNKPDFACSADAGALARCQAHFTMWTIMKSPLILGNDLRALDAATFSVLSNADAISVNQDALGRQAQRVASTPPPPAGPAQLAPGHTAAVLARCDAARPTQAWRWRADGALATRDARGAEWCLHDALASGSGEEGSWVVAPCGSADGGARTALRLAGAGAGAAAGAAAGAGAGEAPLQLLTPTGSALGWCTAPGASGPLPHTRYLTAAAPPGAAAWAGDWAALASGRGGALRAVAPSVLDSDALGAAAAPAAGPWCLDATADGQLEVWAGPLTGGRWAVALFNRAPADAPITAAFAAFNATGAFAVRDVWAGADRGTFTGSYTATVPTRATVYLILSPA